MFVIKTTFKYMDKEMFNKLCTDSMHLKFGLVWFGRSSRPSVRKLSYK